MSPPRAVFGGERVVVAVGQGLQREEGMRLPSAAEVDLERVRLPPAVRPDRGEIHCAAAYDTLSPEPASDLQRLHGEQLRVLGIGRKVAPEVRLPVRLVGEANYASLPCRRGLAMRVPSRA